MFRFAAFPFVALFVMANTDAQTLQFGLENTYSLASAGAYPTQVQAGDLDGDGTLDIVVENFDRLMSLRGAPDGSLSLFASQPNCCSGGFSFALGRFNSDMFGDAIIAASSLVLMSGDAQGGLTMSGSLFGSSGSSGLARAVASADLNGDGQSDLAFGRDISIASGTSFVYLYLSDGAGGFLVPAVYPTCDLPLALTFGDLDADGDLDLVSACASNQIEIFINLGGGVFATPVVIAREQSLDGVKIADINGDGRADLVVSTGTQTRILSRVANLQFAVGPLIPSFSVRDVGDLDGDGRVDLVGSNGPTVQLIRNLGAGALASPVVIATPGSVQDVHAARLGSDLRLRVLFTTQSPPLLGVLHNLTPDCNGNGIDDPVEIAAGGTTDCNANGIPDFCEGDCDANGTLDPCQIAANPAEDLDADGTLEICETAGVPYCFGDGTGNACPCDPGQAGSTGSGCRNSGGNGGRLEARGNPSVSVDSVTLRSTALLPAAIGLLFQGNGQQAGGLGGNFGDGLLCVNQSVVRFGIRSAVGGALSFGYGVAGDPRVSAAGQVPAAGATRYYQHWYRDPAPFCTAGTFNLTNAVRIDWLP